MATSDLVGSVVLVCYVLGASLSHADEKQVFVATRPHMPRLSICIQLEELEKDSGCLFPLAPVVAAAHSCCIQCLHLSQQTPAPLSQQKGS